MTPLFIKEVTTSESVSPLSLIQIPYSKKFISLGSNVKINFVKDRPGHDIRYALNSNKIKKKLGWYPKTNFSEGIKSTLDWYFKNKSYYKSLSKKDILNRLGKA